MTTTKNKIIINRKSTFSKKNLYTNNLTLLLAKEKRNKKVFLLKLLMIDLTEARK